MREASLLWGNDEYYLNKAKGADMDGEYSRFKVMTKVLNASPA